MHLKKRFFTWLILLGCLPGVWAGEGPRPNLLFIMTDQQRFDAMSMAGNTVLEISKVKTA